MKHIAPLLFNSAPSTFAAPNTPRHLLHTQNTDLSYTIEGASGEFAGTRGQSKTTVGLKMRITNPNFGIWYKGHIQDAGWHQPWVNDGQFAGVTNKRLEALGFYIFQY